MGIAQRLGGAGSLAVVAMALTALTANASAKPARPSMEQVPMIFQISPVRVNPHLQPNIMILGQNLTPTTRVDVGSLPAQTLDASDSYHLLVRLPADLPAGSYLIHVTNDAGTVTADDLLQVDSTGITMDTRTILTLLAFGAAFLLVTRLARTPHLG